MVMSKAYNHAATPKKGDGREEATRSNLSEDDCCRWLKKNVWDEKDENDETVAVPDEIEAFCHAIDTLAKVREGVQRITYPAIFAAPRFVLSIKLHI
jgi:hypothetical protein